ncbi:N-acetylglucosamine-specific PTS transporter subunit IIBC [Azospirillum sp. TSO35-2]|uniref:N-acetylglucosamine-specific PTS transporter subunit IIBC n=1 Tax=Azospirillum sp. TSO35-2 TaxID=716796 RepID=UPI000D619B7C|nr:N-acetylglucosamine-specific PTS transporter subunit IIBC [Azospirillum sp. TSO35-2]PWC35907.1 PTS N-acetyl-D-glucosamine transporter [Azospirillum sp. TSO35-2]
MSTDRFSGVQRLGRALMLPIAVLPIAGLLLRLGQPDLLNIAFIAAAGDAVFSNLGLLFAVGIAVGFARENHGAAGLAGAVGYFVAVKGAVVLSGVAPDLVAKMSSRISIPVGILIGIIAGQLYNRYKDIKLPDYLAFFGGRRFVPIVTGLAALGIAILFGYGWPAVDAGLTGLTTGVLGLGKLGLFLYGVLNRVLIITGLHHIINNIAWFLLGDYQGVTGDLNRFFKGDPTAGAFMAGFFPVMMFGLPAACLAMYHTAKPENRAAVGGVLLSMALTAFLTGVTEPVEFAFIFLAPVLFAVHAVLTGVAMVLMDVLNVKLGFGFSAGLFDYVLNYGKATNPILLLPIGAVYFALYYGLFRFVILRFDLKTLGRDDIAIPAGQAEPAASGVRSPAPVPAGGVVASDRATAYLAALGGAENLRAVEACTTRLRLSVADGGRVNEAELKRLGARGVVRPSNNSVQVIVGPIADQLAGEIQDVMRPSVRA